MTQGSYSFLYYPDSAFNERFVFIRSSQIDIRSARNIGEKSLQRSKFTVGHHRRDLEASREVIVVDTSKCMKNCLQRTVSQMCNRSEANISTQSCEERNFVDKEDFSN